MLFILTQLLQWRNIAVEYKDSKNACEIESKRKLENPFKLEGGDYLLDFT